MADSKLLHKDADFQQLIAITAERIGASEGIVEKDYYVTEILRSLAGTRGLTFLFKGGTSLSKGYGLIRRFSEDVDILILNAMGKKPGQSVGTRLLKSAEQAACIEGVTLDPQHEDSFSGKIPPKRVSILNYPRAKEDNGILPYIKLEMSIHSGSFPSDEKSITSLVAQQIMAQAADLVNEFSNVSAFNVKCLDPLRTFAEKVNALVAAYRKGETVVRMRHYYDLFYLLGMPSLADRLNADEHKEIKTSIIAVDKELGQFDSAHNYEQPGTSEAFDPPQALLGELKRANEKASIFYGERPNFVGMMDRIKSMRDKF